MSEPSSKSDLYLRIIAIFKLIKAVVFLGAGIGVLHFLNKDVEDWLQNVLDNSHVDSDNHLAQWLLNQAGNLTNTKLEIASAACFFYGSLFAVEGVGLYLKKRWAEWFVVIVTGSLLPVEIYELTVSVHWAKVVLILINILILSFLVYVIRTGKKTASS